jgi:hypothetical protein
VNPRDVTNDGNNCQKAVLQRQSTLILLRLLSHPNPSAFTAWASYNITILFGPLDPENSVFEHDDEPPTVHRENTRRDGKDRMVTRLTRVQKYLGEGIGHVPLLFGVMRFDLGPGVYAEDNAGSELIHS